MRMSALERPEAPLASAPFSSSVTRWTPAEASAKAMLVPMTPPPTTTTSAVSAMVRTLGRAYVHVNAGYGRSRQRQDVALLVGEHPLDGVRLLDVRDVPVADPFPGRLRIAADHDLADGRVHLQELRVVGATSGREMNDYGIFTDHTVCGRRIPRAGAWNRRRGEFQAPALRD